MEIEKYISECDYKSAISECIKTKQNHFGILLARIINEKNDEFCKLKNQLINSIKKETDILMSNKESNTVSKIRVKMLCHWLDSVRYRDYCNKFTQGDYTWNNILLVNEKP